MELQTQTNQIVVNTMLKQATCKTVMSLRLIIGKFRLTARSFKWQKYLK